MAGKKRLPGAKKDNRGGPRPNSGRKKQVKTISEKAKRRWELAGVRFKRKYGQTVEESILDMIMDKTVQDTCRVAAAKLYTEALVSKVTEANVNVSDVRGPQIYLPPMDADPALKVVEGGKLSG